jgi:hypothetical protein
LDRLRLLLMTTLGTWTLQATVYLALGLLLIGGFFGWVEYSNQSRRNVDVTSVVGHVLADSGERPVALVNGAVDMVAVADSPTVRYLAGRNGEEVPVVPFTDALGLPDATRLLFAPADWRLVWQLVEAKPTRTVTTLRDLHANPLLYLVD